MVRSEMLESWFQDNRWLHRYLCPLWVWGSKPNQKVDPLGGLFRSLVISKSCFQLFWPWTPPPKADQNMVSSHLVKFNLLYAALSVKSSSHFLRYRLRRSLLSTRRLLSWFVYFLSTSCTCNDLLKSNLLSFLYHVSISYPPPAPATI